MDQNPGQSMSPETEGLTSWYSHAEQKREEKLTLAQRVCFSDKLMWEDLFSEGLEAPAPTYLQSSTLT